jgi:hypothetical protein
MNKKFDFKDITLVPETISSINSRSQIDIFTEDNKLPIFVSPMDTVVDLENYNLFLDEKLEVCLPRFLHGGRTFSSISLVDFEKVIEWYGDNELNEEINILVDIANGHMADRAIRSMNTTTKELKELQFEYKTLKGEVMFKSEENQVIKATEPLGLKVAKELPQRLQVEKLQEPTKK